MQEGFELILHIYRGVTYNGRSAVMFLFLFHPPNTPTLPPPPVSLAYRPFCDCQVGSVLTACILNLLMAGDDMINRYEEQFS